MTKDDLQAVARTRLRDAEILLASSGHSGAYYLAGYAVEIGLKAVIAKQFLPDVIPDRGFVNAIYTHDLAQLVRLAGLSAALERRRRSVEFRQNWLVVTDWSEAARYEMIDSFRARDMVKAVGDPAEGVLAWLIQNW